MKKVLAILLAIAMIAAMAACAQKAAPADETKTSGETTSTAGEIRITPRTTPRIRRAAKATRYS